MHVNTFPPGGVESQVVMPALPVKLQVTVPLGNGAPGLGFTVAVIVKVSPKFGTAGVELNVIEGVPGPSVTLAEEVLLVTER